METFRRAYRQAPNRSWSVLKIWSSADSKFLGVHCGVRSRVLIREGHMAFPISVS